MNTKQEQWLAIARNALRYLEGIQDFTVEDSVRNSLLITLQECLHKLNFWTRLKAYLMAQLSELRDLAEFRKRVRQLKYLFDNNVERILGEAKG